MVADDALDHAEDPARSHRALERLSNWLSQATQEGRAPLSSLRTSTRQRNDLADAFRRAGEDSNLRGAMKFALTVEGASRDTHPIVRDDVYRIGYEAIRNACTHSEGTALDVQMSYSRDLVLRVRDNGKGIDPAVVVNGKDGHFGLKGMQERADRVGGRLSVQPVQPGTEVQLIVPGSLAFRREKKSRETFRTRMRRFFWVQ